MVHTDEAVVQVMMICTIGQKSKWTTPWVAGTAAGTTT